MKNIIKKILISEQYKGKSYYSKFNNSKLQKVAFKLLDRFLVDENYDEFAGLDMVEHIERKLVIEYHIATYLSFTYMMSKGNYPLSEVYLTDWLYRADDAIDFLKSSGFYEMYLTGYENFNDITKTDDNKFILSVGNWSEFIPLFDNAWLAEQTLSEDFPEYFSFWQRDVDFEELCNLFDQESIAFITTFIVDNLQDQKISGLDHREEFTHMLDDDGLIDVTKNREEIKSINDSELLCIFIEDSSLWEDDITSHLYSSYSLSYNVTTEDELTREMIAGIESLLGDQYKWGENSTLEFDVSSIIESLVNEYIESSLTIPLDEHHNFIDMIDTLFSDYIADRQIGVTDLDYYYPDTDKLKDNFNAQILEY